jgi:hypothetical protein
MPAIRPLQANNKVALRPINPPPRRPYHQFTIIVHSLVAYIDIVIYLIVNRLGGMIGNLEGLLGKYF